MKCGFSLPKEMWFGCLNFKKINGVKWYLYLYNYASVCLVEGKIREE
jgi:hypothetical protein